MIEIGKCNKSIMFVSDYPDDMDFTTGTINVYSTYNTLNSLVTKVFTEYSWDDFYLTFICRSPFPRNTKINTTSFNRLAVEHTDMLIEDLAIYKPKVIVAFGARAVKYLIGKTLKESINKLNKIDPKFGHECYVIATESVRSMDDDLVQVIFNDILKAIEHVSTGDDPFENDVVDFKLITNLQEFEESIDMCVEAGVFCHDYETDGGEYFDPSSVATVLGYCFQPGYVYILPLNHESSPFNDYDIAYLFGILNDRIFGNIDVVKIAHNLKYEMHWHRKYGVTEFRGIFEDTMLMSHLCNENEPNGLKDIVKQLFSKYDGYVLKPGKDETWATLPMGRLTIYNAIDCHTTMLAYIHYEHKLLTDDIDESGNNRFIQYAYYRNLTMFAFKMLQRMEYHGAYIDSGHIEKSIEVAERRIQEKYKDLMANGTVNRFIKYKRDEILQATIEEYTEKMNSHAANGKDYFVNMYRTKIQDVKNNGIDYEINFNSPTQLSDLLFISTYGFNLPVNPATNKPETSKEYLHTLDEPFVEVLLAYRSIGKMVSTYYKGILDKLDKDSKLHTSFNMHGTVTGRLSSSRPNLQNIPTRTKHGDPDVIWAIKEVKKFFVIPEGYVGLQFDFSQAELRLIANFSGDEVMQEVYNQGKDIHAMTGAQIAGMGYEEFLTSSNYAEVRNDAKSANFGLVYDISLDGYINYIKAATGKTITMETAKKHYESLFTTYPRLSEWHVNYKFKAMKYGYVRTLFGRKRRLGDVYSSVSKYQSKALRNSINAPIQGSGGEWTIFVMALLDCVLPQSVLFFNTVHDSFFAYCPPELVAHTCKLVDKYASKPPVVRYFKCDERKLIVPMKLDLETSTRSWGDMEKANIDGIIEQGVYN